MAFTAKEIKALQIIETRRYGQVYPRHRRDWFEDVRWAHVPPIKLVKMQKQERALWKPCVNEVQARRQDGTI